ncbi:homeobox protein Hox-A7 [Trichinella spiralis]|uniref:homeobox protein Hox-A7 n=1 Tax=Trichinella spiralis TaxID=6334 RepID=UPI0001EFC98E|nr:homeobox protein Hox-A7 [Trichinella spiralis]
MTTNLHFSSHNDPIEDSTKAASQGGQTVDFGEVTSQVTECRVRTAKCAKCCKRETRPEWKKPKETICKNPTTANERSAHWRRFDGPGRPRGRRPFRRDGAPTCPAYTNPTLVPIFFPPSMVKQKKIPNNCFSLEFLPPP